MDETMKQKVKNTAMKYAEKYAQLSIDFIFEIANDVSSESKNIIDDAVISVINPIKTSISNIIDKIYKEEGE